MAYALIKTKTEDDTPIMLPAIDVSASHYPRLYVGKLFSKIYELLRELPVFDMDDTVPCHFSIAAKDNAGNYSELSTKTTILAVNRKRPAPPVGPSAFIGKPDYYNSSGSNHSMDAWPCECFIPGVQGNRLRYFYKGYGNPEE